MTNLATRIPDGRSGALVARSRSPWSLDPFDLFSNFSSGMASHFSGGVEIARTDNGYQVDVPVPGYAPDQINLTYQDGALAVSGNAERRSFTRTLVLPDDIDPDKTTAHVEHGLLTITLVQQPEAQPKKIRVEAGH